MCLSNLTTKKAKTAKEDIVCFKALDENLLSPYKNHKYELGVKVSIDPRYPLCRNEDEEITRGLHSFQTLEDAKTEPVLWHSVYQYSTMSKNIVIHKAIIPKGAKYFEGVSIMKDIYIRKAYASNELIVLEKV